MSLVRVLRSLVSRPRCQRLLMTPVGLAVFAGGLVLVVYVSLWMDRAVGIASVLPPGIGYVTGSALLSLGLVLWIWCVIRFGAADGTPLPFNPPTELVTGGPYAIVRNPMLIGVFGFMFGLGFMLQSFSLVVVLTPAFIICNVIELKLIEEPDLERRFGARYIQYKKAVPMFIPDLTRMRLPG